MSKYKLGGMDKVVKNFDKFLAGCKEVTPRTVNSACLLVLREARKTTPVDTGYLRASSGILIEKSKDRCQGTVYFPAEYAIYVHERLELKHKSGKRAKFLELAFVENLSRIKEIFKRPWWKFW